MASRTGTAVDPLLRSLSGIAGARNCGGLQSTIRGDHRLEFEAMLQDKLAFFVWWFGWFGCSYYCD